MGFQFNAPPSPSRAQRSVRTALRPTKAPAPGRDRARPPTVLSKAPQTAIPRLSHAPLHPPPGVGFQRRGPRPPSLGVSRGSGGKSRNPPRIFLRGPGGVFFQFGKNTSPDAAGHHLLPLPAGTAGHPGPGPGPNAAGHPLHPRGSPNSPTPNIFRQRSVVWLSHITICT